MSQADDFDDELDGEQLDPHEAESLASALRAALEPAELDGALHERIFRQALFDPLAPPSDAERAEAERLRQALDGRGESDLASLAEALRFANGTARVEPSVAEAAHERALVSVPRRRDNVVFAAFGAVGGMLALAAAVALVVSPARKDAPPRERAELARSRSLAPLMNVEAARLSPSERIDRIAAVRERDLRQNRYTKWGVH
ncbi:MAG: hypothetical protein QM756_13155 [Polyangiaceae bacterium]